MIITGIPLKYLILSIQVSVVKMVIINLDLERKKKKLESHINNE
jgi:hypothetical protein